MKKLMSFLMLFIALTSYGQLPKEIIIQKPFYAIHYSLENKVPIYTEYYFTAKNRKPNQVASRSAGFKSDDAVPSDKQANNKDYAKPYDRGHLTPDDDMRFSTDAEKATMLFTNCAPQWSTFNEILWRSIENYVRDLGDDYDTLDVVTGIIVDTKNYIGNGIKIPSYYYKAIQIKMNGHILNTIAFLGKNEDYELSNQPNKKTNISNFAISVSKLEKMIGYKIFANDKFKDNNVLITPQKHTMKK